MVVAVATAQTCPVCGRPAQAGPPPESVGSERARPFQFVRNGAEYYSCPDHGRFSVRKETVEGERVRVAVVDANDAKSYWVVPD